MAFLQQMFPLSSIYLQEAKQDNTCSVHSNLRKVLEELEAAENDKIVIAGPDTVDKTSLVFQAAVSAASVGVSVTYICTHPLKHLPTPVHGMPSPEPAFMQNVDFLYLEESNDLITWFAGVHAKSRLPGLIIVEDVLTYSSQLNDNQLEKSLARILATISDAASWIAAKNDSQRCSVVMTAPARVVSLSHVLFQCAFKVAEYHGPSKNNSCSEVSFSEGSHSITVKFKRHKDSLMLTEAIGSVPAQHSKPV